MAAPTARVWERYGQLRIYVSADDRQLGWYDPRSGRAQLSDSAMEARVWVAASGSGPGGRVFLLELIVSDRSLFIVVLEAETCAARLLDWVW